MRDFPNGYLIPARDTPLGLATLEELLGNRRRRRRRRRHLVPIVPICLFPENKSVYVQKIKAYVQKIKAFVSCLCMMEFGIYKEKMKNNVFTKNWDMTDFLQVKTEFLMKT